MSDEAEYGLVYLGLMVLAALYGCFFARDLLAGHGIYLKKKKKP